jgi:CHASE3 domain sensor protein
VSGPREPSEQQEHPAVTIGKPMRLRIGAKLLFGFVVAALFTGAVGAYAVLTMERLNQEQRTTYVDVFGGTHLLATYSVDSRQARSDVPAYLLTDDPAEHERLRQEINTIDAKLKLLVQQMDEADTDRQDVETLAGLVESWNAYAAWRDQSLFPALDAAYRDAALTSYHTQGVQLANTVDQAIDAFMDKKREVAGSIEASAEVTYDYTRAIAIGLSLAAVAFGLLVVGAAHRLRSRATPETQPHALVASLGDWQRRRREGC